MDKLQTKLKLRKESLSKTANKRLSRSAIVGSIIATIIVSTPLLYSLHESVPTVKVWNTFLFTYESGAWEEAQFAMWVYTSKIIPLILLIIWFFTCKHWWYHAILVPIIMFAFQAVITWNAEAGKIDEGTFVVLLPILVVIVPSIYLIRAKMFNKINTSDKSLEELEAEFMIKPKGVWGRIKQYF
ncbi:hypothetical protein DFQ10_102199 [Winogradskyella eximia]|jgi:hypothetical protein|uniref:Uncharacterized protein n=1 Tax=Winogradskyella eximia TaxID=262006 RepID=A0A3D9H849_9FLAO|nr:hypothetical protein [Winogradskyella eximia]RED45331.1 hypothetical protein DFQ10_102199 [Winogradskyella eximia]|tara:strand:+ start:1162 stop:1716 length:555 start_codon:yes stop_codon:yes gene_type:complete